MTPICLKKSSRKYQRSFIIIECYSIIVSILENMIQQHIYLNFKRLKVNFSLYMPSSQHYHISKIMDIIIAQKPSSVLDIGTGFGKYGVLCREYLDLWDGRQKYEFVRRIDGVEIFENYITPIHEFVYNKMYTGDIKKMIDTIDFSYDLVLLIDVLEHFNKQDGKSLLNLLVAKNNAVLVSTPKNPSPQEDAFGNIYETHRSKWTKEELSNIGECYFLADKTSFIVYISKDKNPLTELQKKLRILTSSKNPTPITNLKKWLISHTPLFKIYKKLRQ